MTDISWLTERPIAHRGLHDTNVACWENTLSAFDAAARRNFAIECDVHLSGDGVPIVFHDEYLNRLTGTEGKIHEKTAAELSRLQIGGTADEIPTLARMLDVVGGRVPLVIELKGIQGKDEGLVGKVADMLRAYRGKAALMSFDHWLIRQFPIDAAGIAGGLTAGGRQQDTEKLEGHFAMLAHDIAFVSYFVMDLPNRFITTFRQKLGRPVITWTVRDQAGVAKTFEHADQMTFEGFDPDVVA